MERRKKGAERKGRDLMKKEDKGRKFLRELQKEHTGHLSHSVAKASKRR